MCNNSEYIRRVIGVTRTFYWTITTGGVDVDLEGRDLRLVIIAAKGGEQEMDFTTDANVLSFVWQGTAQTRIDKYSVVLWENYGEDSQRRVDIHNFVELVPWCAEQSGEYPDLTEETIELGTSDFTDQSGAAVAVVDSLDSHSTTAALSANMGRELNETKQGKITAIAPAYLQNDTLRLRMLAIGNDVMGFVGTQVYPEVTEQSGKDAIMPSIKAIEDHIVTPLQTAIGGKQDTIQDLPAIRSGAAAGATAYQKPASGIPATDLAQSVQNALDDAASAYQKPASGIPATDLAQAVQDDLTLAASSLQDAPSDGKQYARKDGEWVEVSASGGGGGSLTIVEVASGTTAITAEAGKYYRMDNTVTQLAITLPTISSSETSVQDIAFAFTTGTDTNVVFSATGEVKFFDGYKIEDDISYVVRCQWNGAMWVVNAIATEPTIYSGNVYIKGEEGDPDAVYIQADSDGSTTYTKLTIIQNGTNVDPTAMMTINQTDGIDWIRAHSHRYLVKYAGEDGNGRAQALVCQLHDGNSNIYADGTEADLTGSEGDVMTKIAPFYWYCDPTTIGGNSVELWVSKTPIIGTGAMQWAGNQMIGTYEARLVLKGTSISDSKTQITIGTTTAPNSYGRSVCNISSNWQSTPTNANNKNIYAADTTYNNTVLFLNKAMHNRGVGSDGESGFCSITWEQNCVIAMLYYLTHPENTNCQVVCGAGDNSYVRVLGSISNMLGMKDTNQSVGGPTTANATATVSYNNVNFFGIENAWGGKTEVIGNAVVGSSSAPALLQLTSPFDFTESTRQVSGTSINAGYPRKLLFGQYFDVLNAYSTSADNSTGYCDYQSLMGTGQAFPRAVYRSASSASANGGVACVVTNSALSNANASLGGRLAFIGTITEAASVGAFKAATDATFG